MLPMRGSVRSTADRAAGQGSSDPLSRHPIPGMVDAASGRTPK